MPRPGTSFFLQGLWIALIRKKRPVHVIFVSDVVCNKILQNWVLPNQQHNKGSCNKTSTHNYESYTRMIHGLAPWFDSLSSFRFTNFFPGLCGAELSSLDLSLDFRSSTAVMIKSSWQNAFFNGSSSVKVSLPLKLKRSCPRRMFTWSCSSPRFLWYLLKLNKPFSLKHWSVAKLKPSILWRRMRVLSSLFKSIVAQSK